MLSKPPRLELFNDIALSYMATQPPGYRPGAITRQETWCYQPVPISLLSPGSHITAINRFPYHHSFPYLSSHQPPPSTSFSISFSGDLLKLSIWFHIQSYTSFPLGSGRQWMSLSLLSLDGTAHL